MTQEQKETIVHLFPDSKTRKEMLLYNNRIYLLYKNETHAIDQKGRVIYFRNGEEHYLHLDK